MQQLSGLDATFLHLESARSPMHIGSVYLLDAAAADGFSHERLKAHIAARLPRVPVLRQRLVEAPLELVDPFWVNDPDFDLDAHVPRVGCPRPGGKRELMALAARIFARPLNRMRPLWEILLVDGLDSYPGLAPGSYAVITRVHHAAIDGVSGAEVMGALLDPVSLDETLPEADSWAPEPIPSPLEVLRHASVKLGRRTADLARFIAQSATTGARLAAATGLRRIDPPKLPMMAPRSRLNQVITTQRVFGGVEFELDAVRALRSRCPGATVNDVLLTICSGALRRHLAAAEELPDDSLVAMVPVSIRPEADRGARDNPLGNQVSAMLVEIATHIEDPVARLAAIHRNTRNSKVAGMALPANRIMDLVPTATAAIAARLYTRMRVAEKHRPFFNLVITNVPGPPVPLYFAGARLESVFGTAPVMDGLGMILVIFSQAGRISVGVTACRRVLPEVERFEADLRAAFEALSGAPERPAGARRRRAASDRPLDQLRAAIDALGESVDDAENGAP